MAVTYYSALTCYRVNIVFSKLACTPMTAKGESFFDIGGLERMYAWLKESRRIVTRLDKRSTRFAVMVSLTCALRYLRRITFAQSLGRFQITSRLLQRTRDVQTASRNKITYRDVKKVALSRRKNILQSDDTLFKTQRNVKVIKFKIPEQNALWTHTLIKGFFQDRSNVVVQLLDDKSFY